jgi:hypothetical protein
MRRTRRLLGILGVVVVAVFFFVPFIQIISANLGGGPEYVGWVSPSFVLFQCGAAVGGYPIQVPNGGTVGGPLPFSARNPIWNCEFPHW